MKSTHRSYYLSHCGHKSLTDWFDRINRSGSIKSNEKCDLCISFIVQQQVRLLASQMIEQFIESIKCNVIVFYSQSVQIRQSSIDQTDSDRFRLIDEMRDWWVWWMGGEQVYTLLCLSTHHHLGHIAPQLVGYKFTLCCVTYGMLTIKNKAYSEWMDWQCFE